MDVITTHINADFDCLGSMVAARRLYPEAALVFPGAQERSLREYFLKNTVFSYDFRRLRDLDLDAITRLILVDVRQSERIGPLAEVARRPGVEVHVYDHHPAGHADLHGNIEHVEPVGSTVTVLTRLFMERGIVPDPDEATIMMLGLYEDTGSLQFTSTTVADYHAAAYLLTHGANLNVVADSLSTEMTADQVALLHALLKARQVLNVNGIDVTIAHASFPRFVGDLAMLAHKLKDMEGLEALLVVARLGDRIFMVGRSRRPEVPMGEILAEFGGGGHAYAASGAVRELTLVQVLERLPEVLRRHVQPCWQARHLMSQPVKSVAVASSVSEVRDLLTRYNINAAPVMDGTRLAGVITRQIVDKAAHHGLGAVAAAEYMTSDVVAVPPEAPMELLKELIVDRNQRFVPVLEEGVLVGAITRTDLLRHLVSAQRALPLTGPLVEAGDGPLFKRKQVARWLRERLPDRLVRLLPLLGSVGDELGVAVCAVGGFVRDLLLHHPNLDLDVVVEGDGIAYAEALARRCGARVRAHRKFATAVVIFPDGFKIDIASTRMEYYLEPGALPEVEHASLKLDLYRRDFTINTLAVALNHERFGELIDFFGAQRDLQERVIRVLHNLSFVEDPTRVFRAVRFEQRLGFRLGEHTEQLLRSAVRMGFVDRVGGPRLLGELTAVLREAQPLPALRRMAALKLLPFLHPELTLSARGEALFEAASRTLHWYELLYAGTAVEHWQVYFLCLGAELDDQRQDELCRRLSMPPRLRQRFTRERAAAHELLRLLERRGARRLEPKASELHRWLHPFPGELLLYLLAAASQEPVRRWLSHFVTHLRGVRIALDGTDLQEIGIAPGPMYKEIQQVLLEARLDGRVATRQDEISLVRKRFLRRPSAEPQIP